MLCSQGRVGSSPIFGTVTGPVGPTEPATIETLKTDAPLLNKILTDHVVQGQLSPAQVGGDGAVRSLPIGAGGENFAQAVAPAQVGQAGKGTALTSAFSLGDLTAQGLASDFVYRLGN